VYSTGDWYTFRGVFGLAKYTKGTFTEVHPGGCTDPGDVIGNDGEAILDAEYASAAAPNAAIVLA
jgi:subtilase family serine protease